MYGLAPCMEKTSQARRAWLVCFADHMTVKETKEKNIMGFAELFLIGVGLSMDAFAAAVCKGLGMRTMRWRQGAVIALLFGGFQAAMPLLGWVLGRQFESYITSIDHWIAFLLLGYLGGKTLWDALHEEESSPASGRFDLRELVMLAVATSIDALAVGITFAFLQVSILPAAGLIGCTTFSLSLAGVWIGCRFGARYKRGATLAGGAILCLIGLKILLEHLGLLG